MTNPKKHVEVEYDCVPCPVLGDKIHLFMGMTQRGICTLMVLPDGTKDIMQREYQRLMDNKIITQSLTHNPGLTAPYVQGILNYLTGKTHMPNYLLDIYGTDFQQAVWQELLHIPAGELTTYGTMAKTLAKKNACANNAYRAVGTAIGQNPISILIPCHRVLHKNPKSMNYRWGISIKEKLISLEYTL